MSKQSEAKAAQGYTDPAPQFKGPAKWADEEIADGNIGIRWVNEAGVQGRPTECDVRQYLERTPTAKGCHCDKCKSFYSSYQTAPRTPYGWQVQGLRDTYKGEFAEKDAKAEAARIGGTAYAFPIYIDHACTCDPSVNHWCCSEHAPPLDDATIAGLEASVFHLGALVNEQLLLLAEVDAKLGVDGLGAELNDGESELIDRVRSYLKAMAPPQEAAAPKATS